MRKINPTKSLILLFTIYLVSEFFNILASLANFGSFSFAISVLGRYSLYIAFAFAILHSAITMGKKKTAVFFVLTWSFGFFSELTGVLYGWVFGPYYYSEAMRSFFGIMAFETPFSWAVIIYLSYRLVTMIDMGSSINMPQIPRRGWNSFGFAVLLSAIIGFCAMNIDMLLDPIGVGTHAWTWIGGGPYFDIPISNFVGWFSVAFFASLLFFIYDLKTPSSSSITNSVAVKSSIMASTIVVLYFFYFVKNAIAAIHLNHPEYVLIGVSTMFPFILVALLRFINTEPRQERSSLQHTTS